MSKVYLGDSVYADFNAIIRGDVILTTENGNGPTNSIYLEPQVIDALNRASLEHNTRAPTAPVVAKCDEMPKVLDSVDELADEVQRRMDVVVDAAVEHHRADSNWPEAAEALSAAIESLLELRDAPASVAPCPKCGAVESDHICHVSVTPSVAPSDGEVIAAFGPTLESECVTALRELFNMVNYALDSQCEHGVLQEMECLNCTEEYVAAASGRDREAAMKMYRKYWKAQNQSVSLEAEALLVKLSLESISGFEGTDYLTLGPIISAALTDRYNAGVATATSAERPQGWQWQHEHNAELIKRDGLMCEHHPGLEFDHDGCAGPGMAWVVEGKEAVIALVTAERERHTESLLDAELAHAKGYAAGVAAERERAAGLVESLPDRITIIAAIREGKS